MRLWDAFGIAADGPAPALQVVDELSRDAARVVPLLYMAAPTLGEALNDLVAYHAIVSTGLILEVDRSEAPELIRFRFIAGEVPVSRHAIDFFGGLIVSFCRKLTGGSFKPTAVTFSHIEPLGTSAHHRLFGVDPEFGADQNTICAPTSTLDLASAFDHHDARQMHINHLAKRLVWLDTDDTTTLTCEAIEAVLVAGDQPTIQAISSRINVSSRTLQRRLADVGTTFREVLDDYRRDQALRQLADTDVPIGQISLAAGFELPSGLYRACDRWTGQTPSQYRRQARTE